MIKLSEVLDIATAKYEVLTVYSINDHYVLQGSDKRHEHTVQVESMSLYKGLCKLIGNTENQ